MSEEQEMIICTEMEERATWEVCFVRAFVKIVSARPRSVGVGMRGAIYMLCLHSSPLTSPRSIYLSPTRMTHNEIADPPPPVPNIAPKIYPCHILYNLLKIGNRLKLILFQFYFMV